MRLMKMFGLAAIAAVAAMAFVGATSASATTTVLCSVHTSLTCDAANQLGSVHIVNKAGTVGTLLNNLVNVLCLETLGQATTLGLANPLQAHTTALTFNKCGTSASHNECTVTTEELPLFLLLKTALNVGQLTADKGIARVKCTVFGFIKIDCKYSANGLSFEVKGGNPGEFKAVKTPVSFIEGSALCPTESTLDGELVSLGAVYILQ